MNYYYIVCGKTNPKRVVIDENKNIIQQTTTQNKEWDKLTQQHNGTKGLFQHLLKKTKQQTSKKKPNPHRWMLRIKDFLHRNKHPLPIKGWG